MITRGMFHPDAEAFAKADFARQCEAIALNEGPENDSVHPDVNASAWELENAEPTETWAFSGIVSATVYQTREFGWQQANDGTGRWFVAAQRSGPRFGNKSEAKMHLDAVRQPSKNALTRWTGFIKIQDVSFHTGVHWDDCPQGCDAEHGMIPCGGAQPVATWELFAGRDDGSFGL